MLKLDNLCKNLNGLICWNLMVCEELLKFDGVKCKSLINLIRFNVQYCFCYIYGLFVCVMINIVNYRRYIRGIYIWIEL